MGQFNRPDMARRVAAMFFDPITPARTIYSDRFYITGRVGELFELPEAWNVHAERAGNSTYIVGTKNSQTALQLLLELDRACRADNPNIVDVYWKMRRNKKAFKRSSASVVKKVLDNPGQFSMAKVFAKKIGLSYIEDFLDAQL